MNKNVVVVSWMLKDGRLVSFIHPEAVKERREAIAKWKGTYEINQEEWDKAFGEKKK